MKCLKEHCQPGTFKAYLHPAICRADLSANREANRRV